MSLTETSTKIVYKKAKDFNPELAQMYQSLVQMYALLLEECDKLERYKLKERFRHTLKKFIRNMR